MNNIDLIKEEILKLYNFDCIPEEQKQAINLFPEQIVKDACIYCLQEGIDSLKDIFGTSIFIYLTEYLNESKDIFEKYNRTIDLDIDVISGNYITIMSTLESKNISDKLLEIIKSDPIISKIQELLQIEITVDYED